MVVSPTGSGQQLEILPISTFYLLCIFVVASKSRGVSAALDLLHGLLEIQLVTALQSLVLQLALQTLVQIPTIPAILVEVGDQVTSVVVDIASLVSRVVSSVRVVVQELLAKRDERIIITSLVGHTMAVVRVSVLLTSNATVVAGLEVNTLGVYNGVSK